ncbi:uncharacterized protein LOC131671337 [Phymastichus coffea]|uniref:uncharacterized protein LOC131671337 n=1 Tax=Phymastichus coffea TaxID=108790 RepID=UPI00273BA6E7|nr:uncharacterized protein LOC131671337 [Phymastichus coffea]XP_058803680.1 uncharacterized protein LOC131671337 [Phymastichus coffea]XP_058803681.1 uncharacterized protein LOC131671337 [Phymastichus coffea]XP_058803682.1 uncharacterized protein LOC131671337 [Phymastichus coffea]
MGKKPRAKLRYGSHIKQYMHNLEHQPRKALIKAAPLELEVKKPSPEAKPRNPAAYPWRYTGQAKGRIFKDIDPVPFDRKIDVPFGVCFNCWQYTHQQANCPKPTLDDHCQNCGRIGVQVSTCPRCRRAYLLYRKKSKIQQVNDDVKSSKVKKNVKNQKKIETSQQNDTSSAELPTREDEYLLCNERLSDSEDEYDDLSKIIVDESIKSAVITDDFLENFLNLINAMQYLPIDKKNDIAQKYLTEHRRKLRQETFDK